MSTKLGVLKGNEDLQVTRFYGGIEKEICVQLSAKMDNGEVGYVQITANGLRTLLPILQHHIIDYSKEEGAKTPFEYSEAMKEDR